MARSRRKARPKSPVQIAAEKALQRARDFEAVALPATAASLSRNNDIEVRREGKKTVAGARRLDAFDALKKDLEPGAYDAVRKFEADLLLSVGQSDRGRPMERVDSESQQDAMDGRMAASDRVRASLGRIGERDGWLLVELLAPSLEAKLKASTWREIVAYITGETHSHAQAAAVRAACANLLRATRAPAAAPKSLWWSADDDWKANPGVPVNGAA